MALTGKSPKKAITNKMDIKIPSVFGAGSTAAVCCLPWQFQTPHTELEARSLSSFHKKREVPNQEVEHSQADLYRSQESLGSLHLQYWPLPGRLKQARRRESNVLASGSEYMCLHQAGVGWSEAEFQLP